MGAAALDGEERSLQVRAEHERVDRGEVGDDRQALAKLGERVGDMADQ